MKPTEYIRQEILQLEQVKPPKSIKTGTVYYVKRNSFSCLEIKIPNLDSRTFKADFRKMLQKFYLLQWKFLVDNNSFDILTDLLIRLEQED